MTWSAVFKELFRLMPLRTWLILAAVVLGLLFAASYCSKREQVGQLKDQATVADARGKSAQEAIAAIADNQTVNAGLRSEAERAQDEIRQADPADRDRVARCKLRQLQGDPAPC